MGKDLVIIGAGGFGREASLLVEEINAAEGKGKAPWELLGFIDEDQAKWGLELRGYPVLGGWADLDKLPGDVAVICVVGDPVSKLKLVGMAEERGREFAALVHPAVELADDVQLGRGVLINKGCIFTTNIVVGDHVSINPGCGIGHDAIIGAYSTLMWRVNISGAVKVGEGCLLGTGATVLQEKTIGKGCTIGAGAVVTKDIAASCTAVGIPAREVK